MFLLPFGSKKPCYKYCLTGVAVKWASCIRYKVGKNIPVADWLNRPEGCPIGKAYDVTAEELSKIEVEYPNLHENQDIQYVSPDLTLAALEKGPWRL